MKKWKISSQLIIIYFLAVFLPMVTIGSFVIATVSSTQRRYYSDLLAAKNDGLRQTIYEITTQIFTISDSIVYNDDLIEFLNGEYETEQDMRSAAARTRLLDRYAARYAGLEQISVYIDRPDMIDYGQFKRVTDEIREADWYKKASDQYMPFWMAYESKDSRNTNMNWNLVLVRKMVLVGGDREAVIMIKIRNSYLDSRLTDPGYTTLISIDDQPVAFSSSVSMYGSGPLVPIDHNEQFFTYEGETDLLGTESLVRVDTLKLSRSSNRLYLVSFDSDAIGNIRRIVGISYIVMFCALILPLIIIIIFTRGFTAQVHSLRDEMGKASRGEYDSMADAIFGSRELTDAFNDLKKMVSDVQRMEAEQYEAQIREQNVLNDQQKMEFKMLSSQINPHFLYNTLETIRMKALTSNDTEVANAIRLLGKSMRYVLDNTGSKDTTLAKELEHLKVYLQIQQLRFSDRLDYRINVQEGIIPENCVMLGLLLQPVAENAVIHGLEDREEGGLVSIDVHSENESLIIDISDNGRGIDAEELETLNRSLEGYETEPPTNSIGLYNINRRIRLSYGENYGIAIESKPGEGTKVSVVLPLLAG